MQIPAVVGRPADVGASDQRGVTPKYRAQRQRRRRASGGTTEALPAPGHR
ncbi:hypothetical protein [Mycolicibacter senuensis]|nr:hypothetical protein [Mycolicibacter senuensis]